MKIETIRFKNLNSLYGEWFIDLTLQEYKSNGIFAITGATGAGKSTILDAICLALYGSTPRLSNINKSSNEIMSRQTGECFAEVVFNVNGVKYCCHWSQHRARKKSDGNLSESKHEVSDPETGRVLESKKRDVATFIIEKTGMDLDRFTRSILLAQGGFSAFLKATPDERAPILEQITGTAIYSDISKKIHERQRTEADRYKLLIAESSGISFLNSEEEEALTKEIEIKTQVESDLTKNLNSLREQIQWKNRISDLKKEISNLNTELERVREEKSSFQPLYLELETGRRANKLLADYRVIETSIKTQNSDKELLVQSEELLKKQIEKGEEVKKRFLEGEVELKAAKELLNRELVTINIVRKLDFEIDKKGDDFKNEDRLLTKINSEVLTYREEITLLNKSLESFKNNSMKVTDYLDKSSSDSTLNQNMNSLKQQFTHLKSSSDELFFNNIKLQKQKDKVLSDEEIYNKLQDDLINKKSLVATLKSDLKKSENKLENLLGGKLKRELAFELNTYKRELLLRVKIASLEESRSQLIDGKPCPLCGAEQHPYAAGNIPKVGDLELKIQDLEKLLDQIDIAENDIKKAETLVQGSIEKLNLVERDLVKAETELKSNLLEEKRLLDEIKKYDDSISDLKTNLLLELKPYSITDINLDNIDEVITNLEFRSEQWSSNLEKQRTLKEDILKIENSIGNIESKLELLKNNQVDNKDRRDKFKKELELLKTQRKELYGEKAIDREELKLKNRIDVAEEQLENLRRLKEDSSNTILESKTNIETLKSRISTRLEEISLSNKLFLKECIKNGFKNVDEYKNSLIPEDRLEHLEKTYNEIEKSLVELSARLKDRVNLLEIQEALKLTNTSFEVLQTEYSSVELKSRELGEELGGLKSKLDISLENKKIVKNKLAEIETQKIVSENWGKLHALIGSADGKKYRNFAQGLTFEQMVSHANRELLKMSDRYLLIRDIENPLELNVIDNYQAGEIRSTKNLSGGESFIISLALALGLSNMASNKVKVDSLFLDEGFGTLDEEALEVALDTLSTLHQDGKLIGIISHVPALKERISTQINVEKTSGGRGKIYGPGCKSI